MTRNLIISTFICITLASPAFSQDVVPVGQGSYASFPPAHEGENPAGMLTRTIYTVDPNATPIPTNDWWTDLLVSQYAGTMWAYPLAIKADDQGVDVYFPTDFNADGSRMQQGSPLQVRAKTGSSGVAENIVIADFESETYPPGWTTTGTAFGPGPAEGTLPTQTQVSGYDGSRLVNSFYNGDSTTGTLTSTAFTITHQYLHFLIAGGNHPGETEVQLVVEGQIIRSATGDNSESLDWHTWDLSDQQGASATLVIIDQSSGGWGHICADHFVLSDSLDNPAGQYGSNFAPLDARANTWSDWLVNFRMADNDNRHMDITMGHGLPFTWIECTDLEPRIVSSASARYFNDTGTVTSFPVTTNAIGIEYNGKLFGIYAPDSTTFDVGGDTLAISFSGNETYIAVGALPTEADLAGFEPYAYAIPRDNRLDWQFDTEQSIITTTWTITAEALRGTNTDIIQGWLPHHYRTTQHDLNFNGLQYTTPRGLLKCTTGNQYSMQYKFSGLLHNIPAPVQLGDVANDFDPDRLDLYLTMYSGTTSYGADTYWGGKDLIRLARYMHFALETGNDAAFNLLRDTLKTALIDWYTYTPGEVEHYFASYPNWGALVGFNESYYSYNFTDHHFHYGYYTTAAAMLGMVDPQFLADYGEMACLVAKEYANWDRADNRFPFLRTFSPWSGHSYAGGLGSPSGNNQESSSEAIQSWAGLFLLGTMLNDEDMRDAGAMGYAIETVAMMEYWQDYYGYLGQEANFHPDYEHTITGILFDNGQAYATYFTANPAWIYGIQWLPISPALNFLATDPVFAEYQFNQMMASRDEWLEDEPNTISQMGTSLGNVVLGYKQLFDPDSVAAEMDALWDADDPVATDNYTGGITYYFTHANRLLGPVNQQMRTDVPTSQVYTNPQRGETSVVIYNPQDRHRLARVYDNDVLAGYVYLPPNELVRATSLLNPTPAFSVLATWPADAATGVDFNSNEIAIVFSEPVDTASLSAVTIDGPGTIDIAFAQTSDDWIAVMNIQGELISDQAYTITLPASIANDAGTQTLGSEYTISFTTMDAAPPEPQAELVAHYRLDETSGTLAEDSSIFDMDGTYVADPALAQAGAITGTGTSVAFNGTDQEVSIGSQETLNMLINDFTVTLWANPTVLGGNRVLFGCGWQDYNGWSLRISGLSLALERLGPTQLYSSGLSLPTNQWTHVAVTYDADNDVTFYFDGEQVAFVPGDSPASFATKPWYIASNGTGDRFSGNLDDIQVYNRALSADDIAYIYNNPGNVIAPPTGDVDANGVIDIDDMLMLIDGLEGPGVIVPVGFRTADLDGDMDVDLQDAAILQTLM